MYRNINDFKKGYQPGTNEVKDEKGDMVTESHRTLARLRNHFDQPLKVHRDNDVRQTAVHTTEPVVPEPSAFEFEVAVEKLKRQKSPDIDKIPAEFI